MPGGIEILPSSSSQNVPLNLNTHHRVNGAANGIVVDDDDEGGVGSIIPDRTGKHSFCRLCLTHADALNPLFPPDAAPDRTLLAQILDCVEVQITLPDDIKSLICNDCVQQIYAFANFKELCKSNDQLLKSNAFTREESDDNEGSAADVNRSGVPSPVGTNAISEDASSTPDVSLFEKLYEQGVEVEAIGQPSGLVQCQDFASMNSEEREAERKAKNAARMRRWRMRQREKHEKPLIQDQQPEEAESVVDQKELVDFKQQEEALRMQQIQEMFAILAQQQLRQVEAEIRRLKSGVQNVPIPQIPLESMIKSEPQQDDGQSSRQASPTSEQQMASLRRSRAEYMRKWRAKRSQSQQQQQQQNQQTASALLAMVGRPPTILPAPGESEKLAIQRHNRAEYMRRWRRERLKQELSPEEFDDWCSKSEQRRRFREWQTVRESASSAGDETMDYAELEPGIRS
ncbi:zinc finger protein 853-like [Armigeres subalbatus]|uniref:zinc finger protein 853-like n=1 Tax=Armigeres subalbatus TaxID=124917 RepID=UPI002ED06989